MSMNYLSYAWKNKGELQHQGSLTSTLAKRRYHLTLCKCAVSVQGSDRHGMREEAEEAISDVSNG
jgi:hypothetical protein